MGAIPLERVSLSTDPGKMMAGMRTMVATKMGIAYP